jgi:hypothetical protein
VIGFFLLVIGTGWFLDLLGVSVPWRLFPAAGVVVIGLALLVARNGRTGLITLGVVLAVTALFSAVETARFVGPVGSARSVRCSNGGRSSRR